jgi:hypothetical protein
MIELSFEEIYNTARRAVREKGEDFKYSNPDGGIMSNGTPSSCWYVHAVGGEMEPGCIVGHILHWHGVPLEELKARESGVGNLLHTLNRDGILKVDAQGERFLRIVQAIQDDGDTWQKAVRIAETASHSNQ